MGLIGYGGDFSEQLTVNSDAIEFLGFETYEAALMVWARPHTFQIKTRRLRALFTIHC